MSEKELDDFLKQILRQEHKTGLEELVEGYRLCALAEGKSRNYICLVASSVKFLKQYLEAKGLTTDATKIDFQAIRGFILHLQSATRFALHPFARPQAGGLSGYTINTYMRSIRAFWSWLAAEGIITENPFSRLKIPKAPHKVIPTFSEEQLKALFAQANRSSATAFRNYVIMLVLLDTMIRVSELIGCRVEDLNLEARCLRVWGKGSRERVVPFGRTAHKALWKYITFYRPESCTPRQDMLFLTADGRPLTKNRVEAILKTYGKSAEIKGVRVSPHTFRHTGAVAFLRNGGDLFTLQRIMGHSGLEVLRGYINLSQSDFRRVHETASPLDNLGISIARVQAVRKSPRT